MGTGSTWIKCKGLHVKVYGHKKPKSVNDTDLPGTGLGQPPLNSA